MTGYRIRVQGVVEEKLDGFALAQGVTREELLTRCVMAALHPEGFERRMMRLQMGAGPEEASDVTVEQVE